MFEEDGESFFSHLGEKKDKGKCVYLFLTHITRLLPDLSGEETESELPDGLYSHACPLLYVVPMVKTG